MQPVQLGADLADQGAGQAVADGPADVGETVDAQRRHDQGVPALRQGQGRDLVLQRQAVG